METLKLVLLAVVQGLTEFLPVSSSGHLVVAQSCLGVGAQAEGPTLELFLHAGTLLSVCVFYRRRIGELLAGLFRGRREAVRYALFVLVSMVPAGIFYAGLKDEIDRVYDMPHVVGALLILNGAMLLVSGLAERGAKAAAGESGATADGGLTFRRALAMGIGQAFAVLPGISRSGTSIAAGRIFGLGPREAAEFSFLMSIPVIAGGAFLESLDAWKETGSLIEGIPLGSAILAALVGAAVGYVALRLLVGMLVRGKFWVFGFYCFAVGLATLLFA